MNNYVIWTMMGFIILTFVIRAIRINRHKTKTGYRDINIERPPIGATIYFETNNGRTLRGFRTDDDNTFADDVNWQEHYKVRYWRYEQLP